MTYFWINPSEALDATRKAQWAFSQVSIGSFLHTEVVPQLQKRAQWRFDSEGDQAVGGRWEPLRPATEAFRAAAGFPPAHPINVRTGTLRDWVLQSEGLVSNSREGVRLVWPGSTAAGGPELTRKFKTAQSGRSSRRSSTVARPVVGWNRVDWITTRTALRGWVKEHSGLRVTSWVGR